MRWRWPLIIGLAVIGVLVWLQRSATEPVDLADLAETPSRDTTSTSRGSAAMRAPIGPTVGTSPEGAGERADESQPTSLRPTVARSFDPSARHSADPCTALSEPVVPSGYEQITVGGITVAWEPSELTTAYDVPFRPIALAHAAAGVLEEAAELTGTKPRAQLTVIVDASLEALRSRFKAPSWIGGLYDGGAVYVPARPNADLGVAMATLRHEIMHAQLHAGVGCVPFWFDEGLASYFAGETPTREWIGMLRSGEPFDLAAAQAPAVFDLQMANAVRLYAVSIAMVVHVVHRGGESALRHAIRIAQAADSQPAALDLWNRLPHHVDYQTLLDALAQDVFGTGLGGDLDAILRGTVCCRDLRSPATFACRAAAQGETTSRREHCRRW
jgi:hypothetical protein